jgi:hypothetical protein
MLFKNTSLLRKYAQISGEDNISTYESTIQNAEDSILPDILGLTQYNNLNTAYTNAVTEDSLSNEMKALLHNCRKVVAPLFCVKYAYKGSVSLSGAGLRRQETANAKSAFQDQTANYVIANMQEAETAVESLYRFLENNKANYPDWTNSDAFKKYRGLLIINGSELQEYYSTHTPYKNYMAMRPKMKEVQEMHVGKIILGMPLYNTIMAKQMATTQNFTDKEKQLLPKVKRAIAYLTVLHSIPMLNIRIDTNGLTVSSMINMSLNDSFKGRSAANGDDINALMKSTEQGASDAIEDLTKFLKDNAGDFPDYIVPVTTVVPQNSGNSFWMG